MTKFQFEIKLTMHVTILAVNEAQARNALLDVVNTAEQEQPFWDGFNSSQECIHILHCDCENESPLLDSINDQPVTYVAPEEDTMQEDFDRKWEQEANRLRLESPDGAGPQS